jgi:SH3-like domain-containing protein
MHSGAFVGRVFALSVGVLALAGLGFAVSDSAQAQPGVGVQVGKSGLPIPRFVSLKAGRINVRVGPGEDYKVTWVFTRPDLPVEVIQEFDNWRRIRDSDGAVGWVFHSLLSGKRTAVVTPWSQGETRPIRATASADAEVTAYLQSGVMASIDRCESGWCRLTGEGFRGWIEQEQLWGVYIDEKVE